MKKPFAILLLLNLGIFGGTLPAQAQSKWIHVVGLSESALGSNFQEFYTGAEHFLSVCAKAHMAPGTGCELFADLKAPQSKPDAGEINRLKPYANPDMSARAILNAMKDALNGANPGDEVVFSFDDHGVSHGNQSCFYPSDGEEICNSDVQKVISKYKRPGVKVFASVDACYSGLFNSLTNKDVCTYVIANERRQGSIDPGIWISIDELKDSDKPVTLEDIRYSMIADQIWGDSGGFGSQLVRDRLCAENNKASYDVFKLEQDVAYSAQGFFSDPNLKRAKEILAVVDSQPKNLLNLIDQDICAGKSSPECAALGRLTKEADLISSFRVDLKAIKTSKDSKNLMSSSKYAQLINDVETLLDRTCTRRIRALQASELYLPFGPDTNLTPADKSVWISKRLPDTTQELQQALDCEKSFQF